MSSGFVSGGTIDNPAERDDAWRAAQQELEANRQQREEASTANDGKSLYDVLQANKAAKQEAFEEANRLKNQFRALDDDEADFLDSVLQETRKKEAEVKKDTLEQLDKFRKHKEEEERKALLEANAGSPETEDLKAQWATGGRKRKKEKEGLLKGVKLRKASSSADKIEAKQAIEEKPEDKGEIGDKQQNTASSAPTSKKAEHGTSAPPKAAGNAPAAAKPSNALALGLGYGSSEDDD